MNRRLERLSAENVDFDAVVARCEDRGARVESTNKGVLVFAPGDATPVPVPAQLGYGRGRLNVLAALKRAGLDVLAPDPPPRRRPSPADVPAKLQLADTGRPTLTYQPLPEPPAGTSAGAAPTRTPDPEPAEPLDTDTVMELLAEAERRDRAAQEQIAAAEDTIAGLGTVVQRLTVRMTDLERRQNATEKIVTRPPGPPDPHAALDSAIRAFLATAGSMALTTPVIAANLGEVDGETPTGNQLGKRLQALAGRGLVQSELRNGTRFWRLPPTEET